VPERPFRTIATGLKFPEGPIAMPDGSVILVEVAAGTLTRISPEGAHSIVARLGGGPNGAAIGPDGRCYVCNNGGMNFVERNGLLLPGLAKPGAQTGWIEAVDLETGTSERLYDDCEGQLLNGPNDIVFDAEGGMWFTDHGKSRRHDRDVGAVYFARADGSEIKCVIPHIEGPNGIGLSPDGERLYVAETPTGRLWVFAVDGPGALGRLEGPAPWLRGDLVANPDGYHMFDSLAVDAQGNISVGSIPNGVATLSPAGELLDLVSFPDHYPTNVCFGGHDLMTAYVTLSGIGHLVAVDWPRAGLPLHFLNR